MEKFIIYSKEQRDKAVAAIMAIRSEPRMVITIEKWKAKRSSDQNRYYHGVVLAALEEHSGIDSEIWHEYFKRKFLLKECLVILDEEIEFTVSTTKLTVKEFQAYIDKITLFAQDQMGVYLPAGY